MSKTMNINQYTFEVIEAEALRLALLPEMAQKYRTSSCGKSFVEIMSGYAREVTVLPLNFKKKPVFGFVVLPQGEIFQKLSNCPFPKGMCGIFVPIDEVYTEALAVDEVWFEKGFSKTPDEEQKISLIHELSHTVHGAYFQKMGRLSEGFAELVPHYLMNIPNPKHDEIIKSLDVNSLPVLGFLNKNGMFADPEDKKLRAQYRSSYISAYLWMLAYVKRLESQRGLNKFEAVNLLLSEFEKLEKLPWSERMQGAAQLIGLSEEVCFGSLDLQKEALNFI